MVMQKLSGIITSSIKIVSYSPLLMRFQLTDRRQRKYNMLIHTHALRFFQEARPGSALMALVRPNQRGQMVVRQFTVFNAEVLV
ncbi:conserved hypothetical protein [Pediococcus acidilactici NGRI 0510Q]|nr:hypothetical protein IV82_GL000451 [Pediococcus acidilactici]GAC45376.1 conserved hypothetical protein [Pediococcus acidilactici NGRI 0510Q]